MLARPSLLLLFLSSVALHAQPDLDLELVASGLSQPVDITSTEDGRLFIVEQSGRIKIINPDHTVVETPFLDIQDRVNNQGWERGLLGLVFHPDYAENGYFYVNYTGAAGTTHIARFSVSENDPMVADPESELTLLTVDQPYSNHNAGDLNFGPDGYLYIGLGDGGSGGDPQDRSQNRLNLLGKMLRIDVDNGDPYAIPEDNPFAFDDFTLDEIWAIGLRNPWRFSFDRETGDMWIGDVGQNEWEEIDFEPAGTSGGLNYGWRCYEGFETYNTTDCQEESAYVPPVHVYPNSASAGCSVTGGYVYRGQLYPQLWGRYIYADFCSDRIWMLTPDGEGGFVNEQVFRNQGEGFSTFGEGPSGELYIGALNTGRIYQIIDANGCTPQAYDTEQVNETCEGDLDGSLALVGDGFTVEWSTGATGPTIDNLPEGMYQATVTDGAGCTFELFFNLVNHQPAAPSIDIVGTAELVTPSIGDHTYQWYLDGEPIAGATGVSYQVMESGDYQVAATNSFGCTSFSPIFGIIINDARSILPVSGFRVAPNPSSDLFRISGALTEAVPLQWKVFDPSGKLITAGELSAEPSFNLEMPAGNWPAGTYRFQLTDGQRGLERQLVKVP